MSNSYNISKNGIIRFFYLHNNHLSFGKLIEIQDKSLIIVSTYILNHLLHTIKYLIMLSLCKKWKHDIPSK